VSDQEPRSKNHRRGRFAAGLITSRRRLLALSEVRTLSTSLNPGKCTKSAITTLPLALRVSARVGAIVPLNGKESTS
jgi:hypothetical protein